MDGGGVPNRSLVDPTTCAQLRMWQDEHPLCIHVYFAPPESARRLSHILRALLVLYLGSFSVICLSLGTNDLNSAITHVQADTGVQFRLGRLGAGFEFLESCHAESKPCLTSDTTPCILARRR